MRKVPQINESTGVSSNYFGWEYQPKVTSLTPLINESVARAMHLPEDPKSRLAELIQRYPIKTYGEHFPSSEFLDAVNGNNRGAVSRLDQIAGDVNIRFIDPTNFTLDDFRKVVVEVYSLVYGSSAGYNPGF